VEHERTEDSVTKRIPIIMHAPTDAELAAILAEQSLVDLPYADVGATVSGPLPRHYFHDRESAAVGGGRDVFTRAAVALRRWQTHTGSGLSIYPKDAEQVVGTSVVVSAPMMGGYMLAPTRVVAVIDDDNAVGFAYGTLPLHPERGEESFIVRHLDDDTVVFELTAFSRPRPLLVLGTPVNRILQRRAQRAMLRAMQEVPA
jgi:uncharacterized protein (UPF0548 family)